MGGTINVRVDWGLVTWDAPSNVWVVGAVFLGLSTVIGAVLHLRDRKGDWVAWGLIVLGIALFVWGVLEWSWGRLVIIAAVWLGAMLLVWLLLVLLRRRRDKSKPEKPDMNDLLHAAAREQREKKQELLASRAGKEEPRDPDKNYDAEARYEVRGQGRYRYIKCTLDKIGNGYDRGVQFEIAYPSGTPITKTWMDVHLRSRRRELAEKGWTAKGAQDPGEYHATWLSVPEKGYDPSVIDNRVVELGPTESLDGWSANHKVEGEALVLTVDPDSPQRGGLRGLACWVKGPSGDFYGQNKKHNPRLARDHGVLLFPEHFVNDPPALRDLTEGEYQVQWDAQGEDARGVTEAVDVATGSFRVHRDGSIE